MKFAASLVATALFIFLLLGVYCVHIWYFRVDVVFYAAILDAFIAATLSTSALFLFRIFSKLGAFEKTQLIAIWLLGGYAFAISIPTVIDRSLSFYILEKLDQRGGAILTDRFEDVFTKEFVHEYRLADVRLTEQEESGTIVIKDGCVMLTDRGRTLVAFSSFFRSHLLPSKRLLMGEYTDALTDPFRNSIEAPDYKCGDSETGNN